MHRFKIQALEMPFINNYQMALNYLASIKYAQSIHNTDNQTHFVLRERERDS